MRVTIRDLLWLAVVAAMAAGWWQHVRAKDALRIEEEQRCEQYSQTIWQAVYGAGLTEEQLDDINYSFNAKWGTKYFEYLKTKTWEAEKSN